MLLSVEWKKDDNCLLCLGKCQIVATIETLCITAFSKPSGWMCGHWVGWASHLAPRIEECSRRSGTSAALAALPSFKLIASEDLHGGRLVFPFGTDLPLACAYQFVCSKATRRAPTCVPSTISFWPKRKRRRRNGAVNSDARI